MDRLARFLSDDFAAPHGFCFFWLPELVWLHVLANILIAGAYFSIPLALWSFVRKRPDIPFNRVFILFASFIMLCGLTHVFGIIVLWLPYYGIEGIVMLITGIVSVATAIFVWKIMPAAVTLPSPSELHKMNQALSKAYEEVEARVKERTRDLQIANAQLTEARERAEKASLAKTEFLANMSHEIRTPMNAVMGLTNILSISQPLTARQSEFISTLQTSASSLLSLIDDLLDISKVESQTVELERIPFNIGKIVQDAASILTVRAKEKNLDLHVNMDEHDIAQRVFMGDPMRLRQIIINLCSNAIKFTDRGSVTINVYCEEIESSNKENICISITDTGIGIDDTKKEIIFQKFIQGDTSVNRKYGGTGLGLAITKRLVEIMGGEITVDSKVGQGSTFTVSVPFEVVTQSADKAMAVEPRLEDMKKTAARSDYKILLVEDYMPNVMVATNFLDLFGYQWETAQNGVEAVEKFESGDFDLILMDVQMPTMNGFDATKAIRKIEQDRNLNRMPIVGLTAYALSGDRERCLEAGMDEYLAKPFSANGLRLMLEKFLH